MTTIIGMKCPESVILTADTQETMKDGSKEPTPKLQFLKGKKFVIGCASKNSEDIDYFVAFMQKAFQDDKNEYNDQELTLRLDDIVNALRNDRLRKSKQKPVTFDCSALLAASLKDGETGLFRITVGKIDRKSLATTSVRRLSARASIGTGASTASMILTLIEKAFYRYTPGTLSCKMGMMLCLYAMTKATSRDAFSGGDNNLALVTNKRAVLVSYRDILNPHLNYRAQMIVQAIREMPKIRPEIYRMLKDALVLNEELVVDFIKSYPVVIMELLGRHPTLRKMLKAQLDSIDNQKPV